MPSLVTRSLIRFTVFVFVIGVLGRRVECNFEILVLHTNDMHSRFDETDVGGGPPQNTKDPVYGGFARLKKALDNARSEAEMQNISSIFLNAGDNFEGSAFYTMLKDEVVSALLPLLGIEAMALGNHEFDDGVDVLEKFLRNINIPVVACNLNFTHEKNLQVPILTPSVVIQKKDRKIGVIGYISPETKNTSTTRNLIFHDEIESISKEARRLKSQGVNIIIALGHSGLEMDKKIAKSVPDVSLVVGAHSHTFLYSPMDKPPSIEIPQDKYPIIEVQANGRKVPVVQAYCFTKYLGKLWITFDDKGNFVSARPKSNPMILDSSIPEDTSVKTKVLEWKKKFETIIHTVLGRINVYMDGWDSRCRERECNAGNFITDAFVDAAVQRHNISRGGWTDAAIALITGGAIRAALHQNKTQGNYTYEEILSLLPYKTPLYKVDVHGSVLRAALELSIAKHVAGMKPFDIKSGEFLHVAGIRVVYDLSKPKGQRISKLDVRCAKCSVPQYAPLDDNATYTVVMSQFLRDGGDGYTMFKKGFSEPVMDDTYILNDTEAAVNYFKKWQVNYPGLDGRITMVNDVVPARKN